MSTGLGKDDLNKDRSSMGLMLPSEIKLAYNAPISANFSRLPVGGESDVDVESYKKYLGESFDPTADIDEQRAQAQSGWEKLGYGAIKMGGTALATFIDGTVGTVAGVSNVVAGDNDPNTLMRYIKNPVSEAMTKSLRDLDALFPIYETKAQSEADFFSTENLTSGKFWADDVIKNFGFTVGMIASGALTGGATFAAMGGNAAKKKILGEIVEGIAKNADNGAVSAIDDMIKAIKAGTISADEAAVKLIKDSKAIKNASLASQITSASLGSQAESRFESLNWLDEQKKSLENDGTLGLIKAQLKVKNPEVSNEEIDRLADIEANKLLANGAKGVFLANAAVLTLSNHLQFKNLFTPSYKSTANTVGKQIEGNISKGFKVKGSDLADTKFNKYLVKPLQGKSDYFLDPIIEGNEELMQQVISSGADSYVARAAEGKTSDGFTEAFKSLASGLNEAYGGIFTGNKESLSNFFVGALTGALSNVVTGDINRVKKEKAEKKSLVTDLNKYLNNSNLNELVNNIAVNSTFDKNISNAQQQNNEFKFNYETNQKLIHTIIAAHRGGKTEQLIEQLDLIQEAIQNRDIDQLNSLLGIDMSKPNAKNVLGKDVHEKIEESDWNKYSEQQRIFRNEIENLSTKEGSIIEAVDTKFSHLSKDARNELVRMHSTMKYAEREMTRIIKDINKLGLMNNEESLTDFFNGLKELGLTKEQVIELKKYRQLVGQLGDAAINEKTEKYNELLKKHTKASPNVEATPANIESKLVTLNSLFDRITEIDGTKNMEFFDPGVFNKFSKGVQELEQLSKIRKVYADMYLDAFKSAQSKDGKDILTQRIDRVNEDIKNEYAQDLLNRAVKAEKLIDISDVANPKSVKVALDNDGNLRITKEVDGGTEDRTLTAANLLDEIENKYIFPDVVSKGKFKAKVAAEKESAEQKDIQDNLFIAEFAENDSAKIQLLAKDNIARVKGVLYTYKNKGYVRVGNTLFLLVDGKLRFTEYTKEDVAEIDKLSPVTEESIFEIEGVTLAKENSTGKIVAVSYKRNFELDALISTKDSTEELGKYVDVTLEEGAESIKEEEVLSEIEESNTDKSFVVYTGGKKITIGRKKSTNPVGSIHNDSPEVNHVANELSKYPALFKAAFDNKGSVKYTYSVNSATLEEQLKFKVVDKEGNIITSAEPVVITGKDLLINFGKEGSIYAQSKKEEGKLTRIRIVNPNAKESVVYLTSANIAEYRKDGKAISSNNSGTYVIEYQKDTFDNKPIVKYYKKEKDGTLKLLGEGYVTYEKISEERNPLLTASLYRDTAEAEVLNKETNKIEAVEKFNEKHNKVGIANRKFAKIVKDKEGNDTIAVFNMRPSYVNKKFEGFTPKISSIQTVEPYLDKNGTFIGYFITTENAVGFIAATGPFIHNSENKSVGKGKFVSTKDFKKNYGKYNEDGIIQFASKQSSEDLDGSIDPIQNDILPDVVKLSTLTEVVNQTVGAISSDDIIKEGVDAGTFKPTVNSQQRNWNHLSQHVPTDKLVVELIHPSKFFDKATYESRKIDGTLNDESVVTVLKSNGKYYYIGLNDEIMTTESLEDVIVSNSYAYLLDYTGVSKKHVDDSVTFQFRIPKEGDSELNNIKPIRTANNELSTFGYEPLNSTLLELFNKNINTVSELYELVSKEDNLLYRQLLYLNTTAQNEKEDFDEGRKKLVEQLLLTNVTKAVLGRTEGIPVKSETNVSISSFFDKLDDVTLEISDGTKGKAGFVYGTDNKTGQTYSLTPSKTTQNDKNTIIALLTQFVENHTFDGKKLESQGSVVEGTNISPLEAIKSIVFMQPFNNMRSKELKEQIDEVLKEATGFDKETGFNYTQELREKIAKFLIDPENYDFSADKEVNQAVKDKLVSKSVKNSFFILNEGKAGFIPGGLIVIQGETFPLFNLNALKDNRVEINPDVVKKLEEPTVLPYRNIDRKLFKSKDKFNAIVYRDGKFVRLEADSYKEYLFLSGGLSFRHQAPSNNVNKPAKINVKLNIEASVVKQDEGSNFEGVVDDPRNKSEKDADENNIYQYSLDDDNIVPEEEAAKVNSSDFGFKAETVDNSNTENDPLADLFGGDDDSTTPKKRVEMNQGSQRIDLDKAQEWLHETFGESIDVQTVMGLLDDNAVGITSDAGIFLSDQAEVGDEYHEAFHHVIRKLISVGKYNALLNEAKKDKRLQKEIDRIKLLFPDKSENWIAEEALCEEFRDFILSEDKSKYKSKPVRKNVFLRIWDWIENFFKKLNGNEDIIADMFNKIHRGGFKNARVKRFMGKEVAQKSSKLTGDYANKPQWENFGTEAYTNMILDGVHYHMTSLLLDEPGGATTMLKNIQGKEEIDGQRVPKLNRYLDEVKMLFVGDLLRNLKVVLTREGKPTLESNFFNILNNIYKTKSSRNEIFDEIYKYAFKNIGTSESISDKISNEYKKLSPNLSESDSEAFKNKILLAVNNAKLIYDKRHQTSIIYAKSLIYTLDNFDSQFRELYGEYLKKFKLETQSLTEESLTELNDENETGLGDNYSTLFTQISSKMSASSLVRFIMSSFDDTVLVNTGNDTYKTVIKKNELGFPVKVDFSKAFAAWTDILSNVNTLEQFKAKVQNVIDNNIVGIGAGGFMNKIFGNLYVDGIPNREQHMLLLQAFHALCKSKTKYQNSQISETRHDVHNTNTDSKKIFAFDSWKKNALSLNIFKLGANNKYEKVSISPIETLKDSLEFLRKLGISFTNTFEIEENKNEKEKVILAAKAIRAKLVGGDLKFLFTEVEDIDNIKGELNNLLDVESKTGISSAENSHISPDGKRLYNATLYSFLTQIKSDVERLSYEEFINECPWLDSEYNMFLKNSLFFKDEASYNNFKANFDIIIHEAMIEQESSEDFDNYATLSLSEIYAIQFVNYQQNKFPLLRPADNSIERYLYMPFNSNTLAKEDTEKLSGGVTKGYQSTIKDYIKDEFMYMTQYLIDSRDNGDDWNNEINIFKTSKDGFTPRGIFLDIISFVQNNKFSLSGEPSNMKIFVEQTVNNIINTIEKDGSYEDVNQIIDKFLKENNSIIDNSIEIWKQTQTENLFNAMKREGTFFEDNGSYNVVALHFDKGSTQYTSERDIKDRLGRYIIADTFSNVEQFKFIFGHPSQYKDLTETFKRFKGGISNTKLSPTDGQTGAWIDGLKRLDNAGVKKDAKGNHLVTVLTVDNIFENTDEANKALTELGYTDIEEADGYSAVNLDQRRDILIRDGVWTYGKNSHEDVYQFEQQRYLLFRIATEKDAAKKEQLIKQYKDFTGESIFYNKTVNKDGTDFNEIINVKDVTVRNLTDNVFVAFDPNENNSKKVRKIKYADISSDEAGKLNSIKPLYYGPAANVKNFKVVMDKTSFGILAPSAAIDYNTGKIVKNSLYNVVTFMVDNNIPVISFKSAVKGATSRMVKDSNKQSKYTSIYQIMNGITPDVISTMDTYTRFWGVQVDTNHERHHTVTVGTQQMKQIYSGIFEYGQPKPAFKQIADELFKLNAERIQEGYNGFLEELGFTRNEGYVKSVKTEITETPRQSFKLSIDKKGKDQGKADLANSFISYPNKGTSSYQYLEDAKKQGIPTNNEIEPDENTIAFVSVNGNNKASDKQIEDTILAAREVIEAGGTVIMDSNFDANRSWNKSGEALVQEQLGTPSGQTSKGYNYWGNNPESKKVSTVETPRQIIVRNNNQEYTWSEEQREKFVELLKSNSTDLSDNMNDMLDLIKTYGIDILYDRGRLEPKILSLIEKRTIGQTFNGTAAYQMPQTMFAESIKALNEQYGIEKTQTMSEEKEYITSSRLKSYVKVEDGQTEAMEVMIPDRFKGLFKTGEVITDKSVLRMIGFRIPTQGPSSIESIIIKEFLPATYGDVIILPTEIVKKAGSDYDIDKLNLYIANFFTNKDGKGEYIDYDDTEGQLERYLEVKGDTPINRNKFKQLAIQNAIMERMHKVLLHPDYYSNLVEPLDDDFRDGKGLFAYFANEMDTKKNKNKGNIKTFAQFGDRNYLNGIHIQNMQGASAVGATAIASTFHIICCMNNVSINPSYTTTIKLDGLNENNKLVSKKYEFGTDVIFKANRDKEGNITLAQSLDANEEPTERRSIGKNTTLYTSASVDNAKNPVMGMQNINTKTLGVALYLNAIGVPFELVTNFLNQPIIEKYVANQNIYESHLAEQLKYSNGTKRKLFKSELIRKTLQDFGLSLNVADHMESNEVKLEQMQPLIGKDVKDLSSSEKALQGKLLLAFIKYQEHAKMIKDATQGITHDTNKFGKSFGEMIYRNALNEKVRESGFFNNYDKITDNDADYGFIAPYMNMFEASEEMLGKLTFIFNDNTIRGYFNDYVKTFVMSKGLGKDKSIKLIDTFIRGFINYAILSKSDVKLSDIMFGKDSLGKLLLEAKAIYPDNMFVRYLQPVMDRTETFEHEVAGIINVRFDPITANQMKADLEQLLYGSNPRMRLFAEKALDYAIASDGIAANYSSYRQFVPAELWEKRVSKGVANLKDLADNIKPGEYNLFRTLLTIDNYTNKNFVPMLPNEKKIKENGIDDGIYKSFEKKEGSKNKIVSIYKFVDGNKTLLYTFNGKNEFVKLPKFRLNTSIYGTNMRSILSGEAISNTDINREITVDSSSNDIFVAKKDMILSKYKRIFSNLAENTSDDGLRFVWNRFFDSLSKNEKENIVNCLNQ